jgi:uncharacterized protein (DUF488 family)
MNAITLYTVGFTRTSAESFFTLLRDSRVKRIIDIRLNASSQLAGFAKREDLRFFLNAICAIDYMAVPEFAPTKELLDDYRGGACGWEDYERRYRTLLDERDAEHALTRDMLDRGCLLCSEHEPDRCHRRLAADYLAEKLGKIHIVHIL